MMGSAREREQVALAIEATAPTVESTDLGWRFRLGLHPHAMEIDARVDDGWVLLDMPFENAPFSFANLAAANGRLHAGVKFAFASEDERVHVRTELPLLEGVDLEGRLFEAGRGFEQAPALARGAADANATEPAAEAAAEGELERLCEAAGWAFTPRSGGFLAVDLEESVGFFQAKLERRADGAVALCVPIEDGLPSDGACAEAVAIFLLRFSSGLRMVRGAGGPTSEAAPPRFEVVFPSGPSASELSEALAALSVAVRFGARELYVLARSERTARSYLEWNAHAVRQAAEVPKAVSAKTPKPKGKRRAAAGAGKSASTRGGRAKRSPRTRKKPQQPKGEPT